MSSFAPIYMDITELVKNPVRTGIQRVEREIIGNWTGPASLIPCAYHNERNEFVEVTSTVLKATMYGANVVDSTSLAYLAPFWETAPCIPAEEIQKNLFNPEVFYDNARAQKYINIASNDNTNIKWLVYDFMPFLYPRHFPIGSPLGCMPYLLAMRRISQLSFISRQTLNDFVTKIRKSPYKNEVVLTLGGDSLRLEKQTFSPETQNFVYFGTVEPRKNVVSILKAFMNIWDSGKNANLYIIGRIDARAQKEIALLNQLQSEPRFHYLGHATDNVLRDVLRKARATIFVSAEEGFGIPPLESLAAGIPVIASTTLPSLNDLPEGGCLKIDPITPETIAEAVEYLLDDSNAARLWNETAQLQIPTWQEFTSRLSDWLHAA